MSKILLVTHLFHVFSRNAKLFLLKFSIPSLKKDKGSKTVSRLVCWVGGQRQAVAVAVVFARQNLVECLGSWECLWVQVLACIRRCPHKFSISGSKLSRILWILWTFNNEINFVQIVFSLKFFGSSCSDPQLENFPEITTNSNFAIGMNLYMFSQSKFCHKFLVTILTLSNVCRVFLSPVFK